MRQFIMKTLNMYEHLSKSITSERRSIKKKNEDTQFVTYKVMNMANIN